MKRFTLALTGLYLTVLLIAWALLRVGSEHWWPVTILLFAPRWFLATPLLVLLPLALFACRAWLPLFALHLVVLLFPIMGLQVGSSPGTTTDDGRFGLCVVTCNLGGGTPRVGEFVHLVDSHGADIVLLQECEWSLADQIFKQLGWRFQHRGGLAIGSRFGLSPAQAIALHGPQRYHQAAAIVCAVEHDCSSDSASAGGVQPMRSAAADRLRIVSVHLPTMRPAIEALLQDPFNGEPDLSEVVDEHARVSAEASRGTRQWDGPLIVAGDFNMPVASSIFSEHWGHLQNAYSTVGSGFGHTKFTRLHGVRIDHVLMNQRWRAVSAEVGRNVGGDHRPLIVRLIAVQGRPSQ